MRAHLGVIGPRKKQRPVLRGEACKCNTAVWIIHGLGLNNSRRLTSTSAACFTAVTLQVKLICVCVCVCRCALQRRGGGSGRRGKVSAVTPADAAPVLWRSGCLRSSEHPDGRFPVTQLPASTFAASSRRALYAINTHTHRPTPPPLGLPVAPPLVCAVLFSRDSLLINPPHLAASFLVVFKRRLARPITLSLSSSHSCRCSLARLPAPAARGLLAPLLLRPPRGDEMGKVQADC